MMSRLIIPPSLLHRTPAAGGRTTDGAVLEKAQTAYYVEQSDRGKRPRDGKIDFPWSAQEVQQQKFGLAKFLPSRV